MNRVINSWYSQALGKDMEIVMYGHFGKALLMLPTAAADYLEYERFLLIDQLKPYIEAGKIKVFSINSINSESWLNRQMMPHHKAIRQNSFNHYVYNEVVPYIKHNTSADTPIITTGASLGALHSMNLFLKRPDLINGTIAMSGCYDLTSYTDGFWNDDVYFNSPEHYMQNMNDENMLNQIRRSDTIVVATGSGNYETPEASRRFSSILGSKGIPHELDIWGYDMPHDWDTWRKMLPYFVETRM
ncbi:MAG: esterase family protein [Saprospiraceae bacterium]|nr:esterase family protein [Saprospiraceae bacterium]